MRFTDVFWDFDGTLFDTYPAFTRAISLALAADGHREAPADILPYTKVDLGHAARHYEAKYGYTHPLDYRAYYAAAGMNESVPFPGMGAMLRATQAAGVRHHIYTHRGESCRAFLQQWGLWDCFTLYVDSTAGFPRKPSPAALAHMRAILGVTGSRCLMVGDRLLDVLAGSNAGMYTCFFDPDGATCPLAHYQTHTAEDLQQLLQ